MFKKDRADKVIKFIENLKHTKGEFYGKPFILMPWQKKIIREIFGTIKPNGYRQYNLAYVEIPKKQGKSELAAAIALYMLCADGEWGAEVYGCAVDKTQAQFVYDVAVIMIEQSPALAKRCKTIKSQKRIVYMPKNSFYQVLSADVPNKHGINASAIIFDELHAQPNRDLWDVMTFGSGDARMQPLIFAITTAGNNVNGIGYEVHSRAIDIKEGRKIDPSFYSCIFGAAEDDDWTDPKVWKKANPSLGVTFDIDKIEQAFILAQENPVEENKFRQLRLNQWVKQAIRWMPMHKWDACSDMVDIEDLKGRECYGGLDLSKIYDLTAFVLTFPPRDETEKFVILPYFWIPEECLAERVKRDHVPYDKWLAQGYIKTTPGNIIDYRFIEQDILSLSEEFVVNEIAYDRYNATELILNLTDEGFTMIPFGQGYKEMSPPTNEMFVKVMKNEIIHNNNPVLRWNFDNVVVTRDPADNIKPDKSKASEKIDGAVASIMALDRAIKNCGGGFSVYDREDRGLIVV
jgi:phage terminase large subunit-like protein